MNAKRTSSRTKNSVLNLMTSFGGQALTTLLKFITRTVFIQTLGKQYLGINGLFSDILTMLSLTELGIDTAINYQLFKPLAEHNDKRVRILMKFYKQAYRVIGIAILVLGLSLIPLLPYLIRDYDSLAVLGIDATLIFLLYLLQSVSSYLFFAYRSAAMKANQRKYILDIADYVVNIVMNIVQILILVFFKDFVLFTASYIMSNIVKNYVNAIIAQRDSPEFFIKEPDSLSKDEIFGLFKDCGALFVYKVNGVVLKATDNLVLSSFIGLSVVGIYSNYLLFYAAIRGFLNQIYNAVKASMGNLFAIGSIEKRYHFFRVMNLLTVIVYGTAAIGIAVCANELLTVWVGADYTFAQPLPILIGIELLFHGLKMNLGQIRNVSGAFRQMWYRPILGIIINVTVSICLVRPYGVYGVILGTISADILTNFLVDPRIIHKYSFENYRPVSDYYKLNLMYLTILCLMCAIELFVCGNIATGYGWFSVFLHILIIVITVPLVYLVLFRSSDECQYLFGLMGSIYKKIVSRNKPTKGQAA